MRKRIYIVRLQTCADGDVKCQGHYREKMKAMKAFQDVKKTLKSCGKLFSMRLYVNEIVVERNGEHTDKGIIVEDII